MIFIVTLMCRNRLIGVSNAGINAAFQIFAKYGQVLKIVTFTKNSKYSFARTLYVVRCTHLSAVATDSIVFVGFFSL